jgi:hypothetical protein
VGLRWSSGDCPGWQRRRLAGDQLTGHQSALAIVLAIAVAVTVSLTFAITINFSVSISFAIGVPITITFDVANLNAHRDCNHNENGR